MSTLQTSLHRTRLRRIGRRDNGLSMTPAEFDAVRNWDERYRYELIHGVLIVNPAPGFGERHPNGELERLLRNYADEHPELHLLTAFEQEVATAAGRRRADRALWIDRDREPNPYVDRPTILVEFVSARRRDRLRDYEIKRDEYRAIGVKEYWVFDRFRRKLTAYRFHPDRIETIEVPESESYQTGLLPGFVLPVARLQAAADRVARPRRDRPGGQP